MPRKETNQLPLFPELEPTEPERPTLVQEAWEREKTKPKAPYPFWLTRKRRRALGPQGKLPGVKRARPPEEP